MVLVVSIKAIYDTHDSVKALGYVLIIIFIPVVGILFYVSFGLNYRKRKLYSKKIIYNDALFEQVKQYTLLSSHQEMEKHKDLLGDKVGIAEMMLSKSRLPLFPVEDVKLLVNGEEKFPEVFEVLEKAKHHIHIEYYIYANDEIGNKVKDILIRKAKEGVEVRFIYDDFGSRRLGKMEKELRAAGAEVYPFYKIIIPMLASRMNYRNHRKIIVVDGKYGFVGGINIDDRYINNGKNRLFWRDTHLMVKGQAIFGLQYTFIGDWNFCAGQQLELSEAYFPIHTMTPDSLRPNSLVQMVDSGPDSELANIMLTFMGAIAIAKNRVYITTPYFIPNGTIMNAIKFAALKGVDVRLLVPGISDSRFVNAASCSNYRELLDVGVRIYRYQKGFVHSKTMVVDDNLSIIGSANMDIRSYDLDFEINASVFDKKLNKELADVFMDDISESIELDLMIWKRRSRLVKLGERIARLLSPLL
jgi:cardiolipin synthase